MFDEKDYIMRMVKEFAVALGKIMGLKAENKIEESQKVLSETLEEFTDLDKEVIEAFPYEILLHKVSRSRQINTEKCLILGELLIQQADIYEINGEKKSARNLYLKSMNILITILQNDKDSITEQNIAKVNQLIDKIGWVNIPNESKLLLFSYHELTRNYAKAEDMLVNLIQTNSGYKDILLMGIAFYKRLTNIDPIELEKGNLPIDEVFEGLANIQEYKNAPR